MSSHPKYDVDWAKQCPVCIGTGRIYPLPLLCSDISDCILHEGPNGIDCPTCEGLGEVASQVS